MSFKQTALYFDDPVEPEVERLIKEAGLHYGEAEAERLLHRAYFRAPESLLVLVALYRYYFYQHRLEDALQVADRALTVAAARLEFPADWRELRPVFLGQGALQSFGLLRFYLHTLKAAGYINLRLDRIDEGRAMLNKLIELDSQDRLGGRALLAVVSDGRSDEAA
ncbi:MAG: hypothetical protein ACFCUJ_15285 [Thiotrichales bacterium]